MLNIYLARPEWFLGVDASLEAFAAIIALLIAFASYKLYRVTRERSYKYFLASFVLLGGSFLSRAVADAFLEEGQEAAFELFHKLPSLLSTLSGLHRY